MIWKLVLKDSFKPLFQILLIWFKSDCQDCRRRFLRCFSQSQCLGQEETSRGPYNEAGCKIQSLISISCDYHYRLNAQNTHWFLLEAHQHVFAWLAWNLFKKQYRSASTHLCFVGMKFVLKSICALNFLRILRPLDRRGSSWITPLH